uniref:Uncharacterized protein n=1 Tax=Leersia perrieri TaxID=77586 RepID=A0A0D9V0G3_9ORYZ
MALADPAPLCRIRGVSALRGGIRVLNPGGRGEQARGGAARRPGGEGPWRREARRGTHGEAWRRLRTASTISGFWHGWLPTVVRPASSWAGLADVGGHGGAQCDGEGAAVFEPSAWHGGRQDDGGAAWQPEDGMGSLVAAESTISLPSDGQSATGRRSSGYALKALTLVVSNPVRRFGMGGWFTGESPAFGPSTVTSVDAALLLGR